MQLQNVLVDGALAARCARAQGTGVQVCMRRGHRRPSVHVHGALAPSCACACGTNVQVCMCYGHCLNLKPQNPKTLNPKPLNGIRVWLCVAVRVCVWLCGLLWAVSVCTWLCVSVRGCVCLCVAVCVCVWLCGLLRAVCVCVWTCCAWLRGSVWMARLAWKFGMEIQLLQWLPMLGLKLLFSLKTVAFCCSLASLILLVVNSSVI